MRPWAGALPTSRVGMRLAAAAVVCTTGAPSAYVTMVTDWLDSAGLEWRRLQLEGAWGPVLAIQGGGGGGGGRGSANLALHLLASPCSPADVQPPGCNAWLTDACAERHPPTTLVHLHEDVWRSRGDIVRARLLARCGCVRSRLFARSTTVRRIAAAEYMPFLDANHLWGSTKAKYAYGLFSRSDELVAVATFSARRWVTRAGTRHASHELLRTCCAKDGAVVGGISRLIRAFVRAHDADDIVTIVDRDWGTALGWRAMGFESVQIMPPLPMAIGRDGIRRHLVGAGLVAFGYHGEIAPSPTYAPTHEGGMHMHSMGDDVADTSGWHRQRRGFGSGNEGGRVVGMETVDKQIPMRAALPATLLERLASFDEAVHPATAPVEWMLEQGFFLIYDSGVERLLLPMRHVKRPSELATDVAAAREGEGVVGSRGATGVVSKDMPEGALRESSNAVYLWERSIPSYAAEHYSSNPGIAKLLKICVSRQAMA